VPATASGAASDTAPDVATAHQPIRTSSDDENVILKLSFSEPTLRRVGCSPTTENDCLETRPPDAYNASNSAFSSHPCAVEGSTSSCPVGDAEPHSLLNHSRQPLPLPLPPPPPMSPLSEPLQYSPELSHDPPTACDAPTVYLGGSACALTSSASPDGGAGKGSGSGLAKVVRLLAEFEEKSKNGDWPLSTSVHCYWCCHRFTSPPLGLPIKYSISTGRFQVVGCFCSLECACAYNFATTRDSVDECLNRYSLINTLSLQLGLGRVVKPAPDRLALSIFGGHMSIGEFRSYVCTTRGQQQVIVNCPPMHSVTQQVEEVCESDLCSEYRYVPLDSERVSRYQEKIRLSRTKPLINFKNTLDHSMKLKYGQQPEGGTAAPSPIS
jgi:hypothetical protein